VCIVYDSMIFVNTGVVIGQQKTPELLGLGFEYFCFNF
jgi:hypothetical protein